MVEDKAQKKEAKAQIKEADSLPEVKVVLDMDKTDTDETAEAEGESETKKTESKISKTEAKVALGKLGKKKKRLRIQVQRGRIYVRSTYNNTAVLATDMHGNTLAWSSSGLLGFKGAKKSTTYAATQVVFDLAEKVQKFGLKEVDIYVKGVGAGRDSAVRTLSQKGFSINMIKDETPIPHNGCRPPKPRRI